MKKDLVCGMDVKDDTKFTTLHGGRKMFFCSHDCQQKFIQKPEQFMKGETRGEGKTKAA